MVAHAAEFLELIERSESIGAGDVRARGDNLARDRKNGLWMRREQILGGEIALGDPRAFIEQPRRRVERLEIDLDDLCAKPGKPRQRRVVGGGRNFVAEKQAAGRRAARQVCTPSGIGPDGPQRPRQRIRIGGILARR